MSRSVAVAGKFRKDSAHEETLAGPLRLDRK